MGEPVKADPKISGAEFEFFRKKIFELAGISLSEAKSDLVQARLRSRLTARNLSDFKDYKNLLEDLPTQDPEWEIFINLLTTNKTDWFRESSHFDYLVEEFLPKWKTLGKKHLKVWCAASSTGEEPYTLSLVLSEALKGTGITYEIAASDIDTKVLALARNGVYAKDRLYQVPANYQSGFALGTKEISGWMKVKKDIKAPVHFHQVNLMSFPSDWDKDFDLVFCRNVLIYFSSETIQKVVESIFHRTGKDAVLVIAHSESLQNVKTSWKYIRPSIYSKGKVLLSPLTKNLSIGEMIISPEPTIVSTILGSCVSVVIFSKSAGVGGITHFALPDRTHATNSNRNDLNFGDTAIRKLFEEISKCPGVRTSDLEAKIIGGGSVIDEMTHSNNIGRLNVETARQTLQALGVRVVGEQVGGVTGRKIYFYSDSGRVRVSQIHTQKKSQKTTVLIVDDSKTMRELLKKIFSCNEIEVIGVAASAEEAWKFLQTQVPDVMTFNIHMPGMDGVTFLQKFLPTHPVPTIMISSINVHESDLVLKALEYGAVDYIQKPSLQEIALQSAHMREKVLTASHIKVCKKELLIKGAKTIATSPYSGSDKIVAIGASTGGTEAIKEVLMSMPSNIPPIVIVQHIPPVFSTAFAKRLNELCPFEVKEAADGDRVIAGRVLIAPGGRQMELVKSSTGLSVRVWEGERVNRHMPSVDVLFNSVASLLGKSALGVILTGMGEDGAQGLLRMRKAGAFTIAQDEASSVVYGMPKHAAAIGAAAQICDLKQVSSSIFRALEKGKVA